MTEIETNNGELQDGAPEVPQATGGAVVAWTPSFALSVDEAVAQVERKNEFFRRVMVSGQHYGVIPGTGTKPTLLKPGAELLLSAMGLRPVLSDASKPVLDYTGAEHGGEPFISYRRACRIYRQTGPMEYDRMLIAQAEGKCHSWETKYRYRTAQRVCPKCEQAAIIAGNPRFNDGLPCWICFKKKGGCGAQFLVDDPAIVSQQVGKTPNPDVADQENTILKMADKRALVAATLLATGCSDIFTQDIEDNAPPVDGDEAPPADPKARAPRNVTPAKTEPAQAAVPYKDIIGAWQQAALNPEDFGRWALDQLQDENIPASEFMVEVVDGKKRLRMTPRASHVLKRQVDGVLARFKERQAEADKKQAADESQDLPNQDAANAKNLEDGFAAAEQLGLVDPKDEYPE